VFDEAFDFAEIEAVGERVKQVIDQNLDAADEASQRADSDLRDAEISGRGDELTVFGVNCGQQLWDVVSVTDARAGLAAAKRRVLELSWRYEAGRYEMGLVLGSP
jgi:hypothetical protein